MSRDDLKFAAFCTVVKSEFDIRKYDLVYDLCCGNSLLGFCFSNEMLGIDNADNSSRDSNLLQLPTYSFYKKNLWEDINLEGNSLLLGVHACGSLTDRIIQLAIDSNNDFAVLTCCHSDKHLFNPKNKPNPWLALELGRDYYLDLCRLAYVNENFAYCGMDFINKDITPKNRIIWGKIR